jgi:serine/threonine protein kinase
MNPASLLFLLPLALAATLDPHPFLRRRTIKAGERLSEGAVDAVYKATDEHGKEVLMMCTSQDNMAYSLKTIYDTQHSVDSPFVVKAFDFVNQVVEPGKPAQNCYTMEYFWKLNLRYAIDKIQTPVKQAEEGWKKVFAKMMLGVKAVHDAKIAHRFIRPHSFHYLDDGTPKLSNFVYAYFIDKRSLEAAQQHRMVDPTFAAPELFNRAVPLKNHQALDIFASGVTLWQMLSRDFTSALGSTCRLIELSDQACKLVKWMTKSDPEKRPTIDKVLSDPWLKDAVKEVQKEVPSIAQTPIKKEPGGIKKSLLKIGEKLTHWVHDDGEKKK